MNKPGRPKTNGMVERFNGRISDVLATQRYTSSEDLEQTLKRYVWLYNQPYLVESAAPSGANSGDERVAMQAT